MGYNLIEASDASNINEQEFYKVSEIQFPNLDSCMGVIAKNGDQLTGIHLVMFDKDGGMFDQEAAQTVVDKLREDGVFYDSIKVISPLLENWQQDLKPAYDVLIKGLNDLSKKQVESQSLYRETGDYKVSIISGKISTEKANSPRKPNLNVLAGPALNASFVDPAKKKNQNKEQQNSQQTGTSKKNQKGQKHKRPQY